MAAPSSNTPDFTTLYNKLFSLPGPVLPPPKVHDPSLSHQISSLSLHPVLETALHILNGDLPSAHFLVRHMQAAPAYESMYLHGILHRIEGDYDNARSWYGDVNDSEVFQAAWPDGEDAARKFIDEVEALRKRREGDLIALEKESMREIKSVIDFCRKKFGEGEVRDASGIWVQPSKDVSDIGQAMVIGGEGWRTF